MFVLNPETKGGGHFNPRVEQLRQANGEPFHLLDVIPALREALDPPPRKEPAVGPPKVGGSLKTLLQGSGAAA